MNTKKRNIITDDITLIKGAMGLLDINQRELSNLVGISEKNLSIGLKRQSKMKKENIDHIKLCLSNLGVEFIDNSTVRIAEKKIVNYTGVEGFRDFMDDVYQTAKKYGGDICIFNSKPSIWYEILGKDWYDTHSKRMEELGNNINIRIIVEAGETDYILNIAKHRSFSKDRWRGKVFYAYGSKLAFLDFDNNTVDITVLEDSNFAESFKIMFDIVWENETKDVEGVS